MPTETETPRPKESNSNMIPDRKRTEVPETSRELNQNNNSLEDIEWFSYKAARRYFILN